MRQHYSFHLTEKQPKVTRRYPALKVSSETYPPYDMEEEETRAFCVGWNPATCSDEELTNKLSLTSWHYTADVTPMPVWGIFAFYPSGGYVADFAVNRLLCNCFPFFN